MSALTDVSIICWRAATFGIKRELRYTIYCNRKRTVVFFDFERGLAKVAFSLGCHRAVIGIGSVLGWRGCVAGWWAWRTSGKGASLADDGFAERKPALAQLAAASVAGLAIPAGPRACTPCPCPTRLRRARRPPAPSCAAAPTPWLCADIPQKPENIARFLKHLGEPTEPPPLAPARAPPYWQARELRHRPQAQTELFDS